MSYADTSRTQMLRRLRQQTIATNNRINPTVIRPAIYASDLLDLRVGANAYTIQTPGGPVTFQCCPSSSVSQTDEDEIIQPPLGQNIYYVAQYGSAEVTFYNGDGTMFGTISGPDSTSNSDSLVIKADSNGTIKWIARIGGSLNERAVDVSVDKNENVYVTGTYTTNPPIFYNSDGTTFTTNITGTGSFIAKYNSAGFVQWTARQTGTAITIKVDKDGNIYAGGQYAFNNGATFYNADGTSGGSIPVNLGGNQNGYFVKYNSTGTVLWVNKSLAIGNDGPNNLFVDKDKNVYVAFSNSVNSITQAQILSIYNVDGTVFDTYTIDNTNFGDSDGFVIKYNTSGNPVWVSQLGGAGTQSIRDVCVDGTGNVYAVGTINATGTLYNADGTSFGTITIPGTSTGSAIIIKYNSLGQVQWVRKIAQQSFTTSLSSIGVDSSNNIYLCGAYNTTVTFYNADNTSFGTLTATVGSTFVAKYATDGTPLWFTNAVSNFAAQPSRVIVDKEDYLYVTGFYRDTITFKGLDGKQKILAKSDTLTTINDAFIVRYTSAGNILWASRFGGLRNESLTGIGVPNYF